MNWTETEHTLAKALQEEPAVWTETCLDPDDLIELIEEGGASADAAGRLGHIAGCAYCQYAYADMRRTLRVAAEARAWQEAVPTPNNVIEPVASPPQNTTEDPKAPRLLFGGFRWPWGRKNLFRQPHLGYALAAVCAGILLVQFVVTRMRFNVMSRSIAIRTAERDRAQAQLTAGSKEQDQYIRTLSSDNARLHQEVQSLTQLADRSKKQTLAAEQATTEQLRLADKSQSRLRTLSRENAQLQLALRDATHAKPGSVYVSSSGVGPNTLAAWIEARRTQVRRARNTGHVEMPRQIAMLIGPEGITRGQSDSFHILAPLCEAVEGDQPIFEWSSDGGAVRYRIEIVEPTTQSGQPNGRVIQTGTTRETSWKPMKPLPRGRTLQWTVTALLKDGREGSAAPDPALQPRARFVILSRRSTVELHALLEDAGNSAVERGILYWQYGLLSQATREFESVQPGDHDHDIAHRLYNALWAQWERKPVQ